MNGFTVHTSNRLEKLVLRLAETMRRGGENPLHPETVVVQSRGMARWVSLEMARINGICANMHFPFPKVFLREISHYFMPDAADHHAISSGMLTFLICRALPDVIQKESFATLRAARKGH